MGQENSGSVPFLEKKKKWVEQRPREMQMTFTCEFSVTKFGEILSLWQNLKKFRQIFKDLLYLAKF